MIVLTPTNFTENIIIVSGSSNKAKVIVQALRLFAPYPVLNAVDLHSIEKIIPCHFIELLLLPYKKGFSGTSSQYIAIKDKIKRIAFYDVPSDDVALRLLQDGIVGAFYHHDPIDIIDKGTRLMLENELWFKRSIISHYILLANSPKQHSRQLVEALELFAKFSHREEEVLFLLSSGCKNAEIAEKLFISLHTVKTHVCHILKKLGVSNRTEVAAMMAEYTAIYKQTLSTNFIK